MPPPEIIKVPLVDAEIQAETEIEEAGCMTGPELMPKPKVIEVPVPGPILKGVYKKMTEKQQKIQTKSKNQLVLDKALEDEFKKTLEIFDVFVESLSHLDPQKFKIKVLYGEKQLEPLLEGSETEPVQIMKKNLISIRKKIGVVIDHIAKDQKEIKQMQFNKMSDGYQKMYMKQVEALAEKSRQNMFATQVNPLMLESTRSN